MTPPLDVLAEHAKIMVHYHFTQHFKYSIASLITTATQILLLKEKHFECNYQLENQTMTAAM